jgi:hypothetical protein
MRTKAIASAKVKTDKVDAKALAQLGAADFVAEVWVPDVPTRANCAGALRTAGRHWRPRPSRARRSGG